MVVLVGGFSANYSLYAGADDAKVPPVPIPNTEVKLGRAEDTWLETTRENRKVPAHSFFYC